MRHTDERSIAQEIDGWPSDRRMVAFEGLIAKERIEQSVRRLDPSCLIDELEPYAASMIFLRDNAGKQNPDTQLFARGRLRELKGSDRSDAIALAALQSAVLAFAVKAVSNKQGQLLTELGIQLRARFSDVPPLKALADALADKSATIDGPQVLIASRLVLMATRWDELSPGQVLEAQCRIIDWTRHNELKAALSASIGQWVVETWQEMTTKRRFQLRMPMRTCPAIEEACGCTDRNLSRAAKILLAAEAATSLELSPEFRELLARLP